jgi:SpoVK/Ycf46/Vps4 family AAA+-type ATPase
VFGSFITWLQEKTSPVFVIATANNVSALPPELLRKGRFDEIFFCDLPDRDDRRSIIDIHLRKKGRDPGQFDLDKLVDATIDYSGAELEQAVVAALYDAFDTGNDLTTDGPLAHAARHRAARGDDARADRLDARVGPYPRAPGVGPRQGPGQEGGRVDGEVRRATGRRPGRQGWREWP